MSHSFTILPMSQSLELKPGQTWSGTITVANPSGATEDFHYLVTVEPYSVVGEDYEIDTESMLGQSQIVDWITIDEPSGTLKPNEKRDVTFTITVPADAAGGGQYAALMVASDPEYEETAGMSVNQSFALGSIIYADIDGDVLRDSHVVSNTVPGFSLSAPFIASATLENNGNTHETAIIDLTAVNKLNGQQIFPVDDENKSFAEIVMPGTPKAVSRSIDNLPVVGLVSVEQKIYFGNQVSAIQQDVVICPIWFMLLAVAVVLGMIGSITGWLLERRRRRARMMI